MSCIEEYDFYVAPHQGDLPQHCGAAMHHLLVADGAYGLSIGRGARHAMVQHEKP
jgi:hypothetical protein